MAVITLSAGGPHYIKRELTDSRGPPAVAYSNEIEYNLPPLLIAEPY